VTWQTSDFPADIEVCPHCGKRVGSSFDLHEVMTHPDKRKYPEEFIEWKMRQNAELLKKKKKK
jgi:hypothetical protein